MDPDPEERAAAERERRAVKLIVGIAFAVLLGGVLLVALSTAG